jgi:tRNA(Ile)-lysidine synthase
MDSADGLAVRYPESFPAAMARLAAGAEPVFLDERGEGLDVKGWAAIPVLAPWARFLPAFDLAPARALATLVGAPSLPDPPLAAERSSDLSTTGG